MFLRGGNIIVTLGNPTFSGSSCTAYLMVGGSNGSDWYYAQGIPCSNGMVIRTIITQGAVVLVYINNQLYVNVGTGLYGNAFVPGQPGIGVSSAPAGNGISAVAIGHLDTVAPNAISAVTGSGFRGRVDLQWPATTDNTAGTGVYNYVVSRNGTILGEAFSTTFQDFTAGTSGTYAYTVQAIDYHGNATGTAANITDSGAVDPREPGVRPLGSYWGGAGEEIDMRSGNLNYTMPVLTAMGRGGKSVNFQLGYNSQNWRQDAAGTWQTGLDTGYGYGWRLQAASLTVLYNGAWNYAGYLFIDSTGAEYLLTTPDGVYWTSEEGLYFTALNLPEYGDGNGQELNFPDGSFWIFGCTSAGTEQDAGTSYPTLIEDNNGNQIIITYYPGVGLGTSQSGASEYNTSSRIKTIEDVRGNGSPDYTFTYAFRNPTDLFPHLTGITNSIGTSENYSFSYADSTLKSPFNGASYGTFAFQQSMTQTGIPLTTSFTYDSTGTGELDQVTTPRRAPAVDLCAIHPCQQCDLPRGAVPISFAIEWSSRNLRPAHPRQRLLV
jgi:hypothetical protein